MARCSRCSTKIGIFAKVFKRAGVVLCETCLAPWYGERKRDCLASLCEGGDPVELFSIPMVQCRDPDVRGGQKWLIGNLAFTDRGVCFVQVGEYRLAGDSLGHIFGLAGVAVTAVRSAARAKRARVQGQSAVLDGAMSFKEILERSPRLIVYPRAEVSNVTYGSLSGFRLHVGKQKIRFLLKGGSREFKRYRQGIAQFVGALKNDYQRLDGSA